ncbi:hypothetical protein XBKB1_2380023 [Xenorhabdus bovienii str. kraussei Becker Underwood]|uniref:Uncharacterized protein n=1 Tax=Xenorhabdus bovienii str. kraussei Becker Underwood TaxID=1398204 RepID=A0A077PU03_XENBV|nr:hypothetical protein XBKB1_2380023 [Xenorhabdus bovienii str. kraussei Becker Underwood]
MSGKGIIANLLFFNKLYKLAFVQTWRYYVNYLVLHNIKVRVKRLTMSVIVISIITAAIKRIC